MRVQSIEGVKVFDGKVFCDQRGYFNELFSGNINMQCVQVNSVFSHKKNTVRGLHFQNHPYAQTKLVSCARGSIFDVVVDLRPNSATYKQWFGITLSEKNQKQLFIPKGLAHGYITLQDDTHVIYATDEKYSPLYEHGIYYGDAMLEINEFKGAELVSTKDRLAKGIDECDANFGTKILVTGSNGQLGTDLRHLLRKKGIGFLGIDRNICDIESKELVDIIVEFMPDKVIHCAAYTNVDKAQTDSAECFRVNASGTKNVVECCKKIGAEMVYISTDFVYSGDGDAPQGEQSVLKPKNIYGQSKLAGEEYVREYARHYIIRAGWLYGKYGDSFVTKIVKAAKSADKIEVVDDQIGTPTNTAELSRAILDIAFSAAYGTYNVGNANYASRYGVAKEIVEQLGLKTKVVPVMSDKLGGAERPLNSRLDTRRFDAAFAKLSDWQTALRGFLEEL